MTINIEVNQLTNEVLTLREEIVGLKAVIRDLKDNGSGRPGIGDWCIACKEHKVSLPSINKKICSCGESEFPLKKGKKSVLENKTGV